MIGWRAAGGLGWFWLALSVFAPPQVSAGELHYDDNAEPSPAEVARAILRAWDEQQPADQLPCPSLEVLTLAVNQLYRDHAESLTRSNSRISSALQALSWFALRQPRVGWNLARLVQTWQACDAPALESERLLQVKLERVSEAMGFSDWNHVIESVPADLKAPQECEASLSALLLCLHRGKALFECNQFAASAAAYRSAIQHARRTFHQKAEARALYHLGTAALRQGDYPLAREVLQESIELRLELGDAAGAATARGTLAHVWMGLGAYAAAARVYTQAIEVCEDAYDVAVYQSHLAMIVDLQGEPHAALQLLEEAEAVFEDLNEAEGLGMVYSHRGSVYYRQTDLLRAREMFESALRTFTDLRLPRQRLSALHQVATVEEAMGLFDAALERFKAGQQDALRLQILDQQLHFAAAMARVRYRLGHYARCLHVSRQGLESARAIGHEPVVPHFLRQQGEVYATLGKWRRAEELFQEALAAARRQGRTRLHAGLLSSLGRCASERGDLTRALQLHEQALGLMRQCSDAAGELQCCLALARLHSHGGATEFALSCLRQGLKLAQAMPAARAIAGVHEEIGSIRLEQDEWSGAREELKLALRGAWNARDERAVARIWFHYARLELGAGNQARAGKFSKMALRRLLRTGQHLGEEDALGLREHIHSIAGTGLLAGAATTASDNPFDDALADVFFLLEASRGLLLAREIHHRPTFWQAHLEPALLEEEQGARMEVARCRAQLLSLPRVERTTADRELDQALAEWDRVVARIQNEEQRVAAVSFPQPLSLAKAQENIDPETGVLLYHVAAENAYLLYLDAQTGVLVPLGSAERIREEVERYRLLASVPGTDERPSARRVADLLLGPVLTRIAAKKRLLISPDAPLHGLPFEALLPGDRVPLRALQRWEILYVPSLTVLASLREDAARQPRGRGCVALGDPSYGSSHPMDEPGEAELRAGFPLVRLPASAVEVQAIAGQYAPGERNLLEGDSATLEGLWSVLKQQPRWDCLHIAGHGVLPSDRPELGGIALAGGELLSPRSLLRRRVGADLVVLSACHVAVSAPAAGEGIQGLVRAFLCAGALRVVAARWRVPDQVAMQMMTGFHARRLHDGMPPAAALRFARLAVAAGAHERAHPYYWASFSIWGLTDPPLTR
jgi:CHAT domain-containing protein/Tfp pilus assembly protein PilF